MSKLTSRKGSSNNRRNLCVCCFKERFVMSCFVLAGILVMYLFTNEIQSYQAADESIIVPEVKRRKEMMILCLPKRIIKFGASVQNTLLIMVNLKRSCIMKAVSRQSLMLIWKSVFLFVFMKRMIL